MSSSSIPTASDVKPASLVRKIDSDNYQFKTIDGEWVVDFSKSDIQRQLYERWSENQKTIYKHLPTETESNSEILVAYHVTTITEEDESWDTLRLTAADDENNDGGLVGLPVVFFTTSHYKKKLPTITVYPRWGNDGTNYKRYLVSLRNFEHYDSWWAVKTNNKKQTRLLLCTAKQAGMLNLENNKNFQKVNDRDTCQYGLKLKDGKWYSNDYNDDKIMVNFVVLDEVKLIDEDSDFVPRKDPINNKGQQNYPNVSKLRVKVEKEHNSDFVVGCLYERLFGNLPLSNGDDLTDIDSLDGIDLENETSDDISNKTNVQVLKEDINVNSLKLGENDEFQKASKK